jgi:hypothetical protein
MLQHYAFQLVWVWEIATESQDCLESQIVSAAIPFSFLPDLSLSDISRMSSSILELRLPKFVCPHRRCSAARLLRIAGWDSNQCKQHSNAKIAWTSNVAAKKITSLHEPFLD